MRTIVGLSGYGRSGKDSVGTFLAARGFKRIAFADNVRKFLYETNPCIGMARASLTPIRIKEVVDNEGWEVAKKLPEVRALLQRIGTEAGQGVFGKTVWVDAAFRNMPTDGRFVITDVRFTHEVNRIVLEEGGKIWRINREGNGPATGEDGKVHVSETQLDDHTFDLTIDNDGTLADLRSKVMALCDLWGW